LARPAVATAGYRGHRRLPNKTGEIYRSVRLWTDGPPRGGLNIAVDEIDTKFLRSF
jgi:hypothetical protein